MHAVEHRSRRKLDYGVKKAPKRKNVPSHYRDQWLRLHKHGVVEVLMNPSEHTQQHSKAYRAIIQEWPVSRIKALSEAPGLGLKGVARTLGITPRTLRFLITGEYTPSATLCRRMEMVETDIKGGADLAADIIPRRMEMRRRMLLFRSWWMNRPASLALPEVTVSIKVKWGKGVINAFELPVNLLPKMRVSSFSGLVETVRAVTVALRKVTRTYRGLLWRQQEEDFWQAYTANDLPEIVERKLKQPAMAREARRLKDASNAQ